MLCLSAGGSDDAVAGSRPSTAGVPTTGVNFWPSVLAAFG